METFAPVTVRLVSCSTSDGKGAWRLEIWETGSTPFSTLIEFGNDELSGLLKGRDLDLVAKRLMHIQAKPDKDPTLEG